MTTNIKDKLTFKKFSGIDNSYRTKTINEIIAQGLSGGEWTVDEKVHGCLHEDTGVMLPNGESVRIADINEGEMVLAYDKNSKEFVPRKVIKCPSQTADGNWMKLTFDHGAIICTDNHKFLTNNRGWVEAKDLTEDNDVVDVF